MLDLIGYTIYALWIGVVIVMTPGFYRVVRRSPIGDDHWKAATWLTGVNRLWLFLPPLLYGRHTEIMTVSEIELQTISLGFAALPGIAYLIVAQGIRKK
jgi:hypothetical protein